MHGQNVTVLGAGVSGLTTALALAEAGFRVQIMTSQLPRDTTSCVAAAFWYPYLVEPVDKAAVWGCESYHRFFALANESEAGILLRPLRVLFQKQVTQPAWASYVRGFEWLAADQLLPGFHYGFRLETAVVEMPCYLPYLQHKLAQNGVSISIQAQLSLGDAASKDSIVVNCTGLGARELCHDSAMYAVRGQVICGEGVPTTQLTFCPEAEAGPLYIVPRSHDCIVGGTSELSESLMPDMATTDRIMQRAQSAVPRLAELRDRHPLVGLRPCRTEVRLEQEILPSGQAVIHNYGHGGGGVTLSWGCAAEVVRIAQSMANR